MHSQLYSIERAAITTAEMRAHEMQTAIKGDRAAKEVRERVNPILHEAGHAIIKLGIALVEAGAKIAHPTTPSRRSLQQSLAHK